MDNSAKFAKIYSIIDEKARSNIAMQGLSGVFGFPFTLIADGGVIFTHYGPMLNKIRAVYSREELSKEQLFSIVKACGKEILADLLLDKVIGQVPIIGIASNMICAKAMTWRLGLLFAMLSARGEEITVDSAKLAAELIRELFPQRNTLMFKKPSTVIAEKLINSVSGDTVERFDDKLRRAIEDLQ